MYIRSYWFCSLWSESRRALSQYLDYVHITHFKIDLDYFYFDNIDFNHFDLTLILMPNIFQVSELMQDSPVEEAGMIKVRYMSLIKKIKLNNLTLIIPPTFAGPSCINSEALNILGIKIKIKVIKINIIKINFKMCEMKVIKILW